MPVIPITDQSGASFLSHVHRPEPSAERVDHRCSELTIGLLNNMSLGALEATEQQFTSILNSASEGFSIRLKRYFLPEIVQGDSVAIYRDLHYESIDSLWDTDLDALIVTGKEPLTSDLRDEPSWGSFVRVLEWARNRTYSTIWSCLASHAAVLHVDGIQRVRSEHKHCGIFDCSRIAEHPITAKLPVRFRMPHSRWNGLVEADLERCGYQLITRTDHAGVDCFIKQDRSLFLFFQGHPEYQPETLLHEYRRDVGRFLRGESPRYPGIPLGYFDEKASRELAKIQRHAAIGQHGETFAQLATLFSATARDDGWHTAGSTIYHNWLEYISSEKRKRVANGRSTGVKTSSDALASAAALQAEIAMSGPVPVVPQG